MLDQYLIATILTFPLVIMIFPNVKYWSDYGKEKNRSGLRKKANYNKYFFKCLLQLHTEVYYLKRDISDNIQEGLDSIHEVKSHNLKENYAETFTTKLDNYGSFLIKNELLIGALINFAQIILKLGLPSFILAGAYLSAVAKVKKVCIGTSYSKKIGYRIYKIIWTD